VILYTSPHTLVLQGQAPVDRMDDHTGELHEPGEKGSPPAPPSVGLDWRHLAFVAYSNKRSEVTWMLAAGVKVDPEHALGVTALHWAGWNGNEQMTAQLLEAGADVNAAMGSGRTPLHLAVQGQHSSIVDLLLLNGADVNSSSSLHGPPLALAVSSRQTDVVSKLLAAGAEPDPSGGESLLLAATAKGHTQIAAQLLAAGAAEGDSIGDDDTQRTVLHLAAASGQQSLVESLVLKGAPLDAQDKQGATALHAALAAGHSEVAAFLVANGADCNLVDASKQGALHVAAAKGNAQLVAALLAADADPLQWDSSDSTPLHLAAAAGHGAVVALLLTEGGMEPGAANPETGYTPLHAAARAQQAEVCQQLITAGADTEAITSGTLLTPLGEAVRNKDTRMIGVLLAAGANPNAGCSDGTLLGVAVTDGAPEELIQQLVEGGADINAMDANGATALHLAVQLRRYGVVELLLQLGASISIAAEGKPTPLLLAVEIGEQFIVQQLAAGRVNLDILSSSGGDGGGSSSSSSSTYLTLPCTPLFKAVVKGDAGVVEALLAAGADASKGTSQGHTPVHGALLCKHIQLAARLIAAGADVNAVNDDFGTPLAVAMFDTKNVAIMNQLLAEGADPTLGTIQRASPLVAAVGSPSHQLLQHLLAAPALKAVKRVTAARPCDKVQPNQAPGAAAAAAAETGGMNAYVHVSSSRPAAVGTPAGSKAVCLPPEQQDTAGAGAAAVDAAQSSMRERMGSALLAAVAAKDMSVVGLLLEAGASPNTLDPSKGAPLHLAVADSDTALVSQLLEAGADVNLFSPSHGTPLGMAVAAQHTVLVGLLLVAGALPDKVCSSDGDAPLNVAADAGDLRIARQLLDAGAAADTVGADGLAPLQTAVKTGHKQLVELLLGRGAALDICSKVCGTPLQTAVCAALQPDSSQDALDVLQMLLRAGANPNVAFPGGFEGCHLLHAAVSRCNVQVVQQLVQAGAELDASSTQGTPLQLAVRNNAGEVVGVLLKAGASPKVCSIVEDGTDSSQQVSLLQEALDSGYYAVSTALLAHGADPSVSHSSGHITLLHAAITCYRMEAFEVLLSATTSPDSIRGTDGVTALLLAVRLGRQDMVEGLLAAGAPPNVVCGDGHCTPLQQALIEGHLSLAMLLLNAGADPNLGLGCTHGTALQLTVGCGPALVRALLAAGAQPDAVAGSNRATPLQLAIHRNSRVALAALLKAGADASVADSTTGNSLLHEAVHTQSSDLVELLVGSTADINATNLSGDTPLLMAVRLLSVRNWSIMQRLLRNPNIDCNIEDASGCTALHYAAASTVSSCNSTAVGQLLARGADPSVRDKKGHTPLHVAARKGNLEAVQQLLAAGADASARIDGLGWTALRLAAAAGYIDVVQVLIPLGMQDAVSAAGVYITTALHLACRRPGVEDMVEDLLDAGVPVDAADSSGNTPLHYAAAAAEAAEAAESESDSETEAEDTDTVKCLLDAGALVSFPNSNGELPLHLALAGGCTAAALQLIDAANKSDKGSINAVTAAGVAPIHLAAVKDNSILRGLLACSALQVNLVDGAGQTGLHKAAAAGHLSNIKQLVQHGASVGVADATGTTPLHLAAAGGFLLCVRALVTAGADRDALDAGGAAPLHRVPLVARNCRLVALLATPSNINLLVGGTTLLHTAAAGGSDEVIAPLLAAGAAPGAFDSHGKCALVIAAQHEDDAGFLRLLRRMLWQHKQQHSEGSYLLPEAVITATQVVLTKRDAKSVFIFEEVMEVLGVDAPNSLWQQLVEQHNSGVAQLGGRPQQQQQQQQLAGQAQPPQQLGAEIALVLADGLASSCGNLVTQQTNITRPVDKETKRGCQRLGAAQAGLTGQQLQQAAGGCGAAATAAVVGRCEVVTLGHVTAAAGLGQPQRVQQLLQGLPAAVHADALTAAAKAAAGAGHYQLCVQLLKQLAGLDDKGSWRRVQAVVDAVLLRMEGCARPNVKVLGPSSLMLCESLLRMWQAVRRQQQQELVDSVVSAVVVWQDTQPYDGQWWAALRACIQKQAPQAVVAPCGSGRKPKGSRPPARPYLPRAAKRRAV
jgi:ankyrin repeat protein